jgi:hypothetical protein
MVTKIRICDNQCCGYALTICYKSADLILLFPFVPLDAEVLCGEEKKI